MTSSIPPFEDIRKALALEDPGRFAPQEWPVTQSGYPETGLEFLGDAFLRDAMDYAQIQAEARPAVLAAAAAVRGDPAASRLVWHFQSLMFNSQGQHDRLAAEIPSLGAHAGMVPLLVLLSGIPAVRDLHRRRGIPPEVAASTLSDIALWMRLYRSRNGRWGLGEVHWLMHHVRGELYRLGRVQFIHGTHWGYVHLFRHVRSREVVLLSRPGLVYMRDGRFDGDNDLHDEAGRWTATLERDGATIKGHAISLAGTALREPVTLPAADWTEELAPDDPVYDLHIPAEEPLDPDAVAASVTRVREFFPRHFPELKPARKVVCYAWLLDPIYQTLLPPTSNLVRFQQRFHLSLLWEHDRTAFVRVFGTERPDLATAPRDTTLRRAILDHYAAGGRRLSGGGGIWKEP